MIPVNRNPSISEVRAFGLTMLGGCAVVGAVLWYWGLLPEAGWRPASGWGWKGTGRHTAALVLWVAGPSLTLLCAASHASGRALYIVWMTLAKYIGTVMTFILLSAMFFLFLPVFALIRLKDPLRLKLQETGSYWEDHEPHEPTIERTMRQF